SGRDRLGEPTCVRDVRADEQVPDEFPGQGQRRRAVDIEDSVCVRLDLEGDEEQPVLRHDRVVRRRLRFAGEVDRGSHSPSTILENQPYEAFASSRPTRIRRRTFRGTGGSPPPPGARWA